MKMDYLQWNKIVDKQKLFTNQTLHLSAKILNNSSKNTIDIHPFVSWRWDFE